MKYTLHPSSPVSDWKNHEFYTSALVLGIDSGLDGIGVCLRRGADILFAQTFLVGDTTRTLEDRRLKRSWRRARKGRKRREALLREWIVRHGILSKERVEEIWRDPTVFQKAFEHRLRGMRQPLKSPEALVSCLRHAIQHRGFDYHLTGSGGFPWGDEMDFSKILQWAKTGCCPKEAASSWKAIVAEAGFPEEKLNSLFAAFDEAVARFYRDEIGEILKAHLAEEKHTNRRTPARGRHYPRELIKRHVREICRQNTHHFASTDFVTAVNELIGPTDNEIHEWKKDGCIIDYHRKTREEAEELWERKTNECPYWLKLVPQADPQKKVRCSLNSDLNVRKFKLLQFLAERTFILGDGLKYHATQSVFDQLIEHLTKDAEALTSRADRPKLGKKELQDILLDAIPDSSAGGDGKKTKKSLQKKSDHNKLFLDQLHDLLCAKRSALADRAGLSSASAKILFDQATANGKEFSPRDITATWKDTLYLWRMEPRKGGRVHPHVQFLLGHPGQYTEGGKTKDTADKSGQKHKGARLDGTDQEHGILRKLFAGQLKDAMGRSIDLSAKLDGKSAPDFVVIETVGEIPSGPNQKALIEKRQKENRARKEELARKYDLGDLPRRSHLLRAALFEQQNPEAALEAICPMTGRSLGKDPRHPDLQIAHIYPNAKGGLFERVNLFLTTAGVNAAMQDRIPRACAGSTHMGQTFLDWPSMRELADRRMRWARDKRALFLREEETVPDWENLTRISRLARQLKVAIEQWLGLASCADAAERVREAARRVGTPRGSQTAACRHAWQESLPEFMGRKKHRAYLRHHLYDAIVLSHIPPGVGLNFTRNGGIFELAVDKRGNPVLSALPGLLPDLQPFEQAHSATCLVHKHRSKKSKQSRAGQTIYSLQTKEHDDASIGLRVREPLLELPKGKQDRVPVKSAVKILEHSGIPAEKLPAKVVKDWEASNGTKPLRLRDGTPVYSVPVAKTKQQPTSLFPHRNHKGEIIGFKTATEAYESCQIWEGPKLDKDGKPVLKDGKPVLAQISIMVPHARNLANFKARSGKSWRPSESIPAGYSKVGTIKKGDLLTLPLSHEGKILPRKEGAFACITYRVVALNTNGQIEMLMAEFHPSEMKDSPWNNLAPFITRAPGSASVLATLLRLKHADH